MSIDQTYHIQDNILEQWFPDASEKVNSDPTPFKADRTFKLALSETLATTPTEIHILEEQYVGKFSAYIEKYPYDAIHLP